MKRRLAIGMTAAVLTLALFPSVGDAAERTVLYEHFTSPN